MPEGLAAVVLDCLAKDKARRPETYAELHDLLKPFSSTAPRRALLRSRFAAPTIDYVILLSCLYVSSLTVLALGGSVRWGPIRWLVPTLYFTLTEGYGGASIGKRMLGLRVQAKDGGPPGLLRVFARSLIFVLASEALRWVPDGFLLGEPIGLSYRQWQEQVERLGAIRGVVSIVTLFVPLALFLFARPRNGFAGLHELISGTRVVPGSPKRSSSTLATGDRAPVFVEPPTALVRRTRGSFVLVTPSTPTASFWRAVDPLLKRDVWIHDLPAGANLSSAARRDLARPGRLRWLAGQRTSTGSWEAFETPEGQPLLALIARPQSWKICSAMAD